MLGSFLKGRSGEMIRAIRNIASRGQRDNLVICMMEYTHSYLLGKRHFYHGLKKLGLDRVEVLMLGYYPRPPRRKVMDLALELQSSGSVGHLAISGHNRSLFRRILERREIDIFQVRYNAVHRGAEKDVFPFIQGADRPGVVSFTATRWGQLLKESKMPSGERPLSPAEAYRFVLSNPSVDICMTGARNREMMQENLKTLESGPLTAEEMERIRRIGDHLYGKPRI